MIIFIESDYKTLLLSMLSDYIDSCESIRKAVENTGTTGGQGGSGGRGSSAGTGASQPSQTQQSNTCGTGTSGSSTCSTNPCGTTSGVNQTNICQQSTVQQASTPQNGVSAQQQQDQPTAKSNNECSFKKFCEKVTNTTCKVLKEINKECGKYSNCRECVGSDDKCKKFISVTMEHCKEEGNSLILQLNKDISPQSLNTIILRFIGIQLYMRVIQEFCLLRDNFTKIIENLSTCYDEINKCTCGSAVAGNCCSTKGKCVCTIFYKLFKAIKLLHDRYCKIIKYMNGESDEDLYRVIPSLSLTRSIYLLTSYFNDYVNSGYMVEEHKCKCRDACIIPGTTSILDFLSGLTSNLLCNFSKFVDTLLGPCCCHKYSSKLDDVVTLLLGGIEDTDDCDGLLSDVISMVSPLVKDKCVEEKAMDSTPNEEKKNAIEEKLQEVKKKKEDLKSVITGIDVDSSCGGTTAGSGSGASVSSGNTCTGCSTDTPSETQGTATNNGCNGTDDGSINSACQSYIGNEVSSGCTRQSDSNTCTCECNCPGCTNNQPGECCCFFKCSTHDDYDKKIKECLGNLVGLLSTEGINCNGSTNSLMCYLCVLKCSICKLKDACTDTGANGNLNQTLKKLPENIIDVVGKICNNTAANNCCEKCTESGNCSSGTYTCSNGDCCQVNDRFSNFTKFLLGTDSHSASTASSCKTITNTLTKLNGTLNTFISGNGAQTNQCNCCNGGTATCRDKCCCGTENCSKKNGCQGTQPIKILSCVIKCGLKGIKDRSASIVEHIGKIEKCLECIQTKMNSLENCYCDLHKCISGLKDCVTNGKNCIDKKIKNLKDAKVGNQNKFKEVIETSKTVLSDICGLYRVYSIESYSYYLSP